MVGSAATPSFLARRWAGFLGFVRKFAKQRVAFTAALIVLIYLVMALTGVFVAPYSYDAIQPDVNACVTRANGIQRCAALSNAPPSLTHLFGTDRTGRDVLARIVHGARYTIGLPVIATLFAVIAGTLLGLSSGYIGGYYDEIVSRTTDILLAVPAIVLALVTISTIVPGLENAQIGVVDAIGATNIALILVIVLLYTPIVSRVIRSATLNLRERGFVEVARLRGETTLYILLREIFPSVLPALAVEASLRFSYAIFLVASLGFLGLGSQPPIPEWGRMVLDARATFSNAPWALWYPVLAIATLIISVNLMADGLQRIYLQEGEE